MTRVPVRFWIATLLLAVLLLTYGSARAASPAEGLAAQCPQAKDSTTFTFQGHRLTETPDITNPELRLANAALSARCVDWVQSFIQRYRLAYPDDYHLFFLTTRQRWIFVDAPYAQTFAEAALQSHPDFTSIKVLMASMALENHDLATASKWLREIEHEQPDDLWAYIDRLRIAAQLAPTKELLATLQAIVGDERFSENARQQAAQTARYEMSGLTQQQRDAVFEEQMKSKPSDADCTLADQAMNIIELRLDPKAGADLIERYLNKDNPCTATPLLHTLLAEAYLWQATKLSPIPDKSNAKLIAKAKAEMHGDFTPIAQRITYRPFLNPVLAFIEGAVDPRQTDERGQTVLCNALRALNPESLAAELDRGADPNAHCDNDTPVHDLLFMATANKVVERQRILRLLLQHGAAVEGLDFCASPDNGDCNKVLLPILQEYEHKRQPTLKSI
jgi:hypothetical protein